MSPTLNITGDAEADALLGSDPLALLIGMQLDQQQAMEAAFAGPLRLQQRIGGLDAAAIAAYDPAAMEAVFRERPVIHRFPGSMAGRVQALCAAVASEYGGDASAIWTRDEPDGPEILRRLEGAARLRRAEGEDLPRPARQAVRRGCGGLARRPPATTAPRARTARWPTSSAPSR